MGVLLKDDILRLANANERMLGIDFEIANLQSCSYDLRVGSAFFGDKIISNEFNQAHNWNIEIKPSQIVTMLTKEHVKLPKNICATVFAINSLSSTGFLILNPGHIDPGYEGPITICAINLSRETKTLSYGDKIFTIIFEELSRDAVGYNNRPNISSLTRKKIEESHSINKARKLSISLFDLIKENEYKPFLKSLIKDVIYQLIGRWVGIIGLVIGIFAGIYGILQYYKDDSMNNQTEILKQKDDSLKLYKIELDKAKKNDSTRNQY